MESVKESLERLQRETGQSELERVVRATDLSFIGREQGNVNGANKRQVTVRNEIIQGINNVKQWIERQMKGDAGQGLKENQELTRTVKELEEQIRKMKKEEEDKAKEDR